MHIQWHTKHSSKTYMFLLKCLHDMDENATHPLPFLEPSLTPSSMPKPNVRKYHFQNKSFLFSKTHYRVSVNILDYPPRRITGSFFPKQSWVNLRDELLDNSPRQFFEKSSLEIPFTIIFPFLSCHALTPITLGSPVHMKCNMPFHNNSC